MRRIAQEQGARFAVSQHWLKGGDGARELAAEVIAAAEDENSSSFFTRMRSPRPA